MGYVYLYGTVALVNNMGLEYHDRNVFLRILRIALIVHENQN